MVKPISLKEWREGAGLTQAELAGKLGVHVTYISMIERGARRPGMRVATSIREFTGGSVTLDSLVPQRAALAA